jgi:hypothetical protein
VLIGPTLNAITEWLTTPPVSYTDGFVDPGASKSLYATSSGGDGGAGAGATGTGTGTGTGSGRTDADHFGNGIGPAASGASVLDMARNPAAAMGDLTSLLGGLTLGLWNSVTGGSSVHRTHSHEDGGDGGEDGVAGSGYSRVVPPIDTCTGVIIHLFIDSPQVWCCCYCCF